MKKVLFIAAIALFSTAAIITTTSCDEDNPISCTQKLVDVSEASSAFTSDPTAANCIAYSTALQDYIDCDGIAAADKTAYQIILDALDCSIY
ncbi:MAG: hypothetical protein PF485_08625 [Bacteroidales bacterium]|jgi:hypothetical protein|nr:hypothetical protein [Bacteroidales bacterium]